MFNHQDDESRLIVEDSLNIIPAINYATYIQYILSIYFPPTDNKSWSSKTHKYSIYLYFSYMHPFLYGKISGTIV